MGQLNNYTYTFTPGTKAESDQVNQNFKDIKNAHNATDTAAFYKDGTKAMTGDADMGSNKVTTMADGTAATDAVNKGQLDGVDVLSAKGDLLTFSTVNARKAIGSNDQILVPDSSETDGLKWTGLGNLSKYLSIQNIKNLILKPDIDTARDTNFFRPNTNYPAQIVVRDASYNTRLVSYSGEITKQIDFTWAVGDDAGGLAAADSLTANTLYYCFPLAKSSDNAVDVGYTTDITGASLLTDAAAIAAGFDEVGVAFVGTVLTDGSSNIISYKARTISGGGLKTSYASKIAEVSTGVAVPAFADLTLSAPPNSRVQMYVDQGNFTTGIGSIVSVKEKDSGLEFDVAHTVDNLSENNINYFEVYTDSNSQIQYKVNAASDTLDIYTLGYINERTL